ncbi:hypothetical protein GCM10023328_19870 [Modestobacter marinus]|uniref:Vacuolar-type H+-ATPase subunit F/Vma7 n=1 Tax=Modestobacter marinus TaxID=477641 RepID=A0A846LHV6_9ACTN|nr:V-type ATP synthase subunit F [Modestobacter marinus]NIH65572.1 vacuolar-type H+-ATPase subunit F/Vma7 [Modestobacter marinus]GGL65501.1 hypothetical protein GCM10011589_22080 [Modestobacter marinus]
MTGPGAPLDPPHSTGAPWPADLLVIVPADTAAGFRLAGTRTVVAGDPDTVRQVVDREIAGGSRGVIAVAERTWAELPAAVRADWSSRSVPLVLPLPAEDSGAAGTRRSRVQELLARSVGYEITFSPGGTRT